MGFGGISLWQLLIILLIVVLVFGTKRLKGIGGDLGGAVKGFRKAMDDGEKEQDNKKLGAESPTEPDAKFEEQAEPSEKSSNQA
ncbi:MAG: Sec-independent protein translocase subunit TatA [Chromatiales bacterium]|jgi:sec-independent protein translocase protein TatA|nr:Sec-independent protein translocase subunit TatA [Chromatiales bacterium]